MAGVACACWERGFFAHWKPSIDLVQVLRAGGHYVLVSCRDPDVRLPLVQRCGFRVQVGHLARVCVAPVCGVACCLCACSTWHAELTRVFSQ